MYEPPTKQWSRTMFRNYFLLAVNEHAKEVLEELGGEPYRLYLESGMHDVCPLPLIQLENIRLYRWMANEILKEDSGIWHTLRHYPKKWRFCKTLLNWSDRFNLSADWVIETALNTLYRWSLKNRPPYFTWERGWFLKGEGGTVPSSLEPPPGLVEYRWCWNRSDYLNSVARVMREGFEELFSKHPELSYGNPSLLNAYIESVKEAYSIPAKYCKRSDEHIKAHGWIETEKHSSLERDMRWTVKFQILNLDFETIAANEPSPRDQQKSVGVSTVSRVVVGYTPKGKQRVPGTLELLGIKRRSESGPGRRRGRKESADSWRRSIRRAQLPR